MPRPPKCPSSKQIRDRTRRLKDREAAARRARESYARRKNAGTIARPRPISSEARARYNTARREKAARARLRIKEDQADAVAELGPNKLSIVAAGSIRMDTTRWTGPRAPWNARDLEKQADEILRRGRP